MVGSCDRCDEPAQQVQDASARVRSIVSATHHMTHACLLVASAAAAARQDASTIDAHLKVRGVLKLRAAVRALVLLGALLALLVLLLLAPPLAPRAAAFAVALAAAVVVAAAALGALLVLLVLLRLLGGLFARALLRLAVRQLGLVVVVVPEAQCRRESNTTATPGARQASSKDALFFGGWRGASGCARRAWCCHQAGRATAGKRTHASGQRNSAERGARRTPSIEHSGGVPSGCVEALQPAGALPLATVLSDVHTARQARHREQPLGLFVHVLARRWCSRLAVGGRVWVIAATHEPSAARNMSAAP